MADLHLTPASDATSCASSSSHGHNFHYDIFINCRGIDRGLASHLYHRFTVHGLRVFLFPEELQGEYSVDTQIQGTIRAATVHVAIFSPGYAESSRCLNELVEMLESRSKIIPIFYGVSPSELRWTRDGDRVYAGALSILQCILLCKRGENGVYARALRMLEKKTTFDSQANKEKPRYDSNIIEKWRKALSDVSQISGFELDACNGDEGHMVDLVVQKVLRELSKRHLNVAKYPTGLDEKVKDLESIVLSQQQSGQTRVVGIVGLGGVGKTTLAKEFFNRHRFNYERSCFVSDVRENAARNSLNSLQATLLKDLAQLNAKISSVYEGIGNLKKHLTPSSPSLIVLDDVDHIDQMDALFLPVKYVMDSGSLILVTSRNMDVLTSSGIVESSIYKQACLSPQHSQELLCLIAFGQPYPPIGFAEVVEKNLDACHGLPLSLLVFGGLLCGRDLEYWKAQLHKISKVLPSYVLSTLKISFDALDEEEKQIFLDIACFFIGEDMDTAIRIWNGSGWEGWLGFRNLQNRCFVEVDSKNCIVMHDHLRDLGRYMAEEEPLRRLTDTRLRNVADQLPVRGINMVDGNDPEQPFENLAEHTGSGLSINTNRLQLLRAEGNWVESILRIGQSPHLLWLCWYSCPFSSLPSWIPLKNLRVLYIKGVYLESLWQHESQEPLQLRELNIDAPLLRVPKSIGRLKHLEKIVLHQNYIETLPDEIGHMHSLKHMELKNCQKLALLPDSIGCLTNLQRIRLSECSSLQMLPDSVGNLTNLQDINLFWCSSLKSLPDSMGNLTNLQSIDLGKCFTLKRLPNSMGNLMNLQSIDLSGCSNLKMLPDSVGNLTNLLTIDFSGCSNLEMLPDSVGSLTNLQNIDFSGCSNLEMLPDSVGNLTNLQNIDFSWCSNLEILPDSLGNLTNLQVIDLGWCSNLQMLPDSVGNLTNLQVIDLGRCSALQMLPDSVGSLMNLQSIDLRGCFALQALPDSIGCLTKLQSIDLRQCSGLQALPDSVGSLTSLQSIDMRGCSALQALPDSVGSLRKLQTIDLRGCSALQALPDSVGWLASLNSIVLSGCSSLQVLPYSVGSLTSLQIIDLRGCSALQALPDSVGWLTSLNSIDLRGCSSLQALPDSVGALTSLKSIYLRGCSALQALPYSVGSLTDLESIDLSGCSSLNALPDSVGSLTNLESIDLSGCSSLKVLPDLVGSLTNLESIDLSGCSSLQALPDSVGCLTSLKSIYLRGCSALQALPYSVGSLTNLESIDLSGCSSLKALPDSIGNLINL